MKKQGTKRINTQRLVLCKMKLFDFFYARRWYCDGRVNTYSQGKPKNSQCDLFLFLLRRAFNYYFRRRSSYFFWGIYLDKKLIGFVEVRPLDEKENYWLYYMVSPDFQSKGYATEAVGAVLDFMKTQSNGVIYGACDSNNKASYRVLEKCNLSYVKHEEDIFHYRDGRVGARDLFKINLSEEV